MTVPEEFEAFRDALLPRYVLGDEVGRGGMAVVFATRDTTTGQEVALKALRPELAAAIGARRFLREIELERALNDRRIVPVLDAGEAQGLPYYTMPLIKGESLRQRLEREPQLPLSLSVSIAIGIADALTAAHAVGIVHRDIKPENILLDGDEPVVSDFGVARAVLQAAGDRLTESGLAIGTPSYMSPEQGSGSSVVDARTDIYSLGCVLYEMLSGAPPFSGSTSQAIVARHMRDVPPPLYVVRPTLPGDLEAIVFRCLAKVPADRFQTVIEVATALRAIDLAHPAPPADALAKRHRRVVIGRWVALAALGVAALSIWYVRSRIPLDDNRVVVFPLDQPGSRAPDGVEGEGERAALLVGTALEHTEPMKWLDGWSLLAPGARTTGTRIDASLARRIAHDQHARYYLRGTLARTPDSIRVTLELHDVDNENAPVQETASAASDAALSRPVLAALVRILPHLSGIGRAIDVTSLVDRKPAAILNWLQGERAYRRSRFEEALTLMRRAVEVDSELAPATLHAAVAASWTDHADEARALSAAALRHAGALSPRDRVFAEALDCFVRGNAGGAIRALRRTLTLDAEHREAWMLLGEVHLHLMPNIALDSQFVTVVPPPIAWPVDSFAGAAFKRAYDIDSGFTPALQHLIEIEIRRGRHEAAQRYYSQLVTAGPDPALQQRMQLLLTCTATNAAPVNWAQAGTTNRHDLATAGSVLISSALENVQQCGVAAFRALLASDSAGAGDKWAALLALQTMLVGTTQSGAALKLVDSAVASGMDPALSLYVLTEIAGVPVGERATRFINDLRANLQSRKAPSLWLVGSWAAVHRDTALLREAAHLLDHLKDSTRTRRDSLLAAALHARLTLASGDSTRARAEFAALVPSAPREDLAWSAWEPLAAERMVYAQLLLSARDFAHAMRVAGEMDHPGIAMPSMFLDASLTLRAGAADSLGRSAVAQRYRSRLQTLRRAHD